MEQMNLLDTILTQTLLSHKGLPKQQQILESAIKLFAEKGYANTSTNEIAKEAGVAEGTLFRYYKTKETLLLALIVPFMQEMVPKIAEDVVGIIKLQVFESFEDLLRFFIINRINFIKGSNKIFQIFVKEVLYRDSLRNELIPHMNPQILNYLNDMLNNFKARGEIKDLPNEVIVRMVGTFLMGYFVSRFILIPENMLKNEDEEIEILIELILNGIKK